MRQVMCLSAVYRITTALLLLTQHGEPLTALMINARAHQELHSNAVWNQRALSAQKKAL